MRPKVAVVDVEGPLNKGSKFICSAWWCEAEVQLAGVSFSEGHEDQQYGCEQNRHSGYISSPCSASHCTAQLRTPCSTDMFAHQCASLPAKAQVQSSNTTETICLYISEYTHAIAGCSRSCINVNDGLCCASGCCWLTGFGGGKCRVQEAEQAKLV
jgi:hypothetical protein